MAPLPTSSFTIILKEAFSGLKPTLNISKYLLWRLYNFHFKWSDFWKDFILMNGSVQGKRESHSIAFDHLNEIYVGLFKRIVRDGKKDTKWNNGCNMHTFFLSLLFSK